MRKTRLTLLLLLLVSAPAFTQNFGRTANGELALRAYQKCFPDKTDAVSFIENDWTITAGEETFFWAGGRLLPRSEKDKIDLYSPHPFWVYPEKPLSPDTYPPQYIEMLRSRGSEEARRDQKDSHRAFHGILYGGLGRRELESRWNPPDPVIRAFEKEGFIWGGKWPLYDNMHFEYRPELHEFIRLLAANPDKSDTAIGSPSQDLHHIAPDFLLK